MLRGGNVLLSKEEFIRISLEVNLFFQRIMKEHLFFIETALHPPANNHIAEAKTLKEMCSKTLPYGGGKLCKRSYI